MAPLNQNGLTMAAKVFISYRREDSAGHAGRVHDRLVREFGSDLLFMDVDGIPLGVNFVKVLQEEVAKCSVLLAVMGHEWLDVRDEDGRRRLDNPDDFVRVEIAAALQRDIPVIPIMLEGTKVPKANQLPNDLQGLGTISHSISRTIRLYCGCSVTGPATPRAFARWIAFVSCQPVKLDRP